MALNSSYKNIFSKIIFHFVYSNVACQAGAGLKISVSNTKIIGRFYKMIMIKSDHPKVGRYVWEKHQGTEEEKMIS